MIDTLERIHYKIFGLRIKSEILIPEVPVQTENYFDKEEVLILKGDLLSLWDDLSNANQYFVIRNNLVMFKINNIAIFLIQNGTEIVVSPLTDYEEDIVRLYLLGTCMGALLMQRRTFPLHGSAVAINGKSYLFVGDSGAGKSTLATEFLNRGFQLLSDDVIAISLQENNTPIVTPSYPQQKLWQESLSKFGMESNQLRSIYGRENKYCVPVHNQYFTEPLPLGGIFEIKKTKSEAIEVSKIEGMERFKVLSYNTYRNYLIPGLGLHEWHFKTSAKIINLIDLYQIVRPESIFSAQQLANIILNIIHKEV